MTSLQGIRPRTLPDEGAVYEAMVCERAAAAGEPKLANLPFDLARRLRCR